MMKNITASWTENTIANTLHDINVQIEPGKLYAIVGSVGAGKVIYPHIYIYIYIYSKSNVFIVCDTECC